VGRGIEDFRTLVLDKKKMVFLGVRRLKEFNLALLSKWSWRIRGIYVVGCHVLDMARKGAIVLGGREG